MNNILTFEDFIKEGLWSKGVERSQTGDVRQEDLFEPDVYWVDMGHPEYLFSGGDHEYRSVTVSDIIEMSKSLKKGILLLDRDAYVWLNKNCERHKQVVDQRYVFESEETGRRLLFDFGTYCFGTPEQNGDEITIMSHCTSMGATMPTKMSTKISEKRKYSIKFLKKKGLNEGLWSKGVDRSKSGEERIEDRLGDHEFTDGNGKTWKHGIKPVSDSWFKLVDTIKTVILAQKDKKNIINLNIIDMSEVESISGIFQSVRSKLTYEEKIDENEVDNLRYDTSGWVLTNCTDFKDVTDTITYDIGVENWKVNPENVKLNAFSGSPYYRDHLPSWFIFNVKDWAKQCVRKTSYFKTGVDKIRTKELGKKCYWVDFYAGPDFPFIPEEVTIREINDSMDSHYCRVNCDKLTTLKKIPKEFTPVRQHSSGFTYHININNIKDDEILIPLNTNHLFIKENDDVTRLPKKLPCGITIHNQKQLGYIDEVDGDFSVGNSSLKSLVGCPKIVNGDVDAHNCRITDLVGAPEYVGGRFTCSNQGNLKSLKGCPRVIDGDFDFYSTGVTNIDDFPDKVGGDVNLSGCTSLENFVGLPEVIDGNLDIGYCNVKSLEGLPKEVKGKLIIGKLTLNKKDVTYEDILKVSPDIQVIVDGKYDAMNLVTGKRIPY